MIKSIMLLAVICFMSFINIASAEVIYNEKEQVIYLGGYSIEGLRNQIDKVEELYFRNKIYVLNIKKGTSQLLLESDNFISTYDISNKGYIAVTTSRKDEKRGEYKNDLIIYTPNGERIKTIENNPAWIMTKHFSWNKDGDKIAYISGRVIIEGRRIFEPTGVWIYDVINDKSLKIADKGVKIKWSRHDDNVYIENDFIDPSVLIYNPTTKKLLKSDKKGIIFSDDGKYYIAKEPIEVEDPYAAFTYHLFDNIENKEIYKFTEEEGFRLEQAHFISNTHYLLSVDLWGYKIFNVDSKKLIKKSDKRIIGLNKDMTKAVVYEGGGKFVYIDSLLSGERIKEVKLPLNEVFALHYGANREKALIAAAKEGYIDELKRILKNNININTRDEHKKTALMWAAEKGRAAAVKLLLSYKNIEINAHDKYDKTALMLAAYNGQVDTAKLLLEQRQIGNNEVLDALEVSSRRYNKDIITLFLTHLKHSNINQEELNSQINKMFLRAVVFSYPAVEVLMQYKDININTKDEYGRTPLMIAVRDASSSGEGPSVRLLLSHKEIDINEKDNRGWTALMYAAHEGKLNIVKQLLAKRNINVNTRNKSGKTALSLAKKQYKETKIDYIKKEYAEIIKCLKKYDRFF